MKQLLILFILLNGFTHNTLWSQENSFLPGEIIVQIEKSTNIKSFVREFEAENQIGVQRIEILSEIAGMYKIEFTDTSQNLDIIIKLMSSIKGLISIQKNHYVTARETIPSDTLFNQQWFHKNTGQTGGNFDSDIDTPEAWDITTGGLTTHNDTIVVCIIEGSGVDITHIDLVDNIWHNYAEIPDDGIDNDNNGFIDDFDGWNVSSLNDAVGSGHHGTRVAGMVGAKGNNTTGVSGVNWDVKMMIVKGQNANNEASVIAAYNYPLVMRKKYNDSNGQAGAFVVVTNASWGINNGDPADSPIWCAMYDTLGNYGILNIGATSNSNVNVDINGDLPTTCSSEYLIGVTMSNSQDLRANSGYGPTHIDLAAPGFGVTLPTSGNLYNTTNGTSFASPCVAGAVALAYSTPCPEFISHVKIDPADAALQMREYILSSTDLISVLAGEVATSGRLNARNCIDSILVNCDPSACLAPYNFRMEASSDTTADFKWDGFSSNYIFYIQEATNTPVEFIVGALDSIAFDTLTACTNYMVWARSICGSDTSANSILIDFKTDGCCDNPNLVIDYASADTITISWADILYATEYDIRYRKEGETGWALTYTDTTSPITFSGLDTCTNYEFQIKTLCTDSTQGFSSSFILSTKGCGSCYEKDYCDVVGVNTNFEWIEEMKIGNSIYTSGNNGGWLEFTNLFHGFLPGQTYSATVTAGYSGSTFSERFSLWVDYDQDGIFEDTEKLISDVSGSGFINANISVPISSVQGVTKMRVAMLYANEPVACPNNPTFTGEYEDYCVYIGPLASITDLDEMNIHLFPNPAKDFVQIQSSAEINSVRLYSIEGKLLKEIKGNVTSLDISEFDAGLFIIELSTINGELTKKLIIE